MNITIAPETVPTRLLSRVHSLQKSVLQFAVTLGFCLTLSACFNGENTMDLGSVSIGQQLIDLKKARDSNAMTEEEYEAAKKSILLLLGDADEDDVNIKIEIDDDDGDEDREDEDKDEEEDSGFLF